jgi:hypothetical protein
VCFSCGHFVFGAICANHHRHRCVTSYPNIQHMEVRGDVLTLGSWIKCCYCPGQAFFLHELSARRSLFLLSCWIRLVMKAMRLHMVSARLRQICRLPPLSLTLPQLLLSL